MRRPSDSRWERMTIYAAGADIMPENTRYKHLQPPVGSRYRVSVYMNIEKPRGIAEALAIPGSRVEGVKSSTILASVPL
jgi:hypothetical protein